MDAEYKCVTLLGELSDMGKHLLMPFGTTLCGLPVKEALSSFPILKMPSMEYFISEYKEETEWEISCDKCLEIFDMLKTKHAQQFN